MPKWRAFDTIVIERVIEADSEQAAIDGMEAAQQDVANLLETIRKSPENEGKFLWDFGNDGITVKPL